ncbi:MAG: hypothetical protein GKS03_08610 [Alphaproteobacteria bacterium]|nr:hypothetical protein [Alphaproteobacteria bacterium]
MAPDNAHTATHSATADELVARAATLGPTLFGRRKEAGEKRSVPDASIAELVESKVLRACMPKRFGGYELPFGAHMQTDYGYKAKVVFRPNAADSPTRTVLANVAIHAQG